MTLAREILSSRSSRAILASLTLSALCACKRLPEVAESSCGNAVIESGEDCDTFAPSAGAICRPKDAEGECHLDCSARSDGARGVCPAGWGCALNGMCRPPTGTFETLAELQVGGALTLMSGDMDGDGRGEVVTAQRPDALGRTKLRFHYFDDAAALVETRAFPKLVISPVLTDLSSDACSDLAFSDFRIGVVLGQRDRSFLPETFSSYRVAGSTMRILSVQEDQVEGVPALAVITQIGSMSGVFLPDQVRGNLRFVSALPGPIHELAGDPVSAQILVRSACRQVVIARRGAATVSMLDLCTSRGDEVEWREVPEHTLVPLAPPAPIDSGPQVTDLNGDGFLDLLIGAGGEPYVAYGTGAALSVAEPYRLELSNPSPEIGPNIPMPLVAGDVTGDGAPDFVLPDRVLVSRAGSGIGAAEYHVFDATFGARWTAAKIVDLNSNGRLDIVAASNDRVDIDLFSGVANGGLIASRIPTNAPVKLLESGDFDGDLISDLAFVEAAPSNGEGDAIQITFGTLFGQPLAPLPVARIANTEQLSTFFQQGFDNLMVSSSDTRAGQTTGALTLLGGSSDRLPFAPYELVSFSIDGSLVTSLASAIAAGHFTQPDAGEILTLAWQRESRAFEFWLVPALDTVTSTQRRLAGDLDPRLLPLRGTSELNLRVDASSATADLDRDGIDEAIWLMPTVNDAECALLVTKVVPVEPMRVQISEPVLLPESCSRPQALPVDADGDGFSDLALLTGLPGDSTRRLRVLWNDGRGRFDAGRATLLTRDDDSAASFTVLRATPNRPLTLVYITDRALNLVSAGDQARQFLEPTPLVEVTGGSGVIATDLNRDGVEDLAVAASGRLIVLRALLAAP